jgi:hypothetical protein
MAVTSKQPVQENKERTWPSLLLGPLIWFLHLNTFYAVASLSCKWRLMSLSIAGLPGLQLVEAIVSLLTLVLLARLIIVPWRNWRRFQTEQPPENPRMLQDTEKDWRPLVAFVALLLNSGFFVFVVATFVPVLALNPCA